MRSLPRASASPAFTREVMRKLHQTETRAARPFVWRMAAAFAMAACLLAVVQLAVMQQRHEARTLALQAEQRQLQADLAAVKQIVSDSEPVVVLENDHGTRVILDIDSATQPASPSHYD
jgi:hypothetical protein